MESLNSSDITADASEESGFLRSGEEGASGFLGLSNRISDSPGLVGSSRLLPRVSITPRDTISPEKTRRFLQSLGMDTGEDLLDQSEEGEIHDDQLQRSAGMYIFYCPLRELRENMMEREKKKREREGGGGERKNH